MALCWQYHSPMLVGQFGVVYRACLQRNVVPVSLYSHKEAMVLIHRTKAIDFSDSHDDDGPRSRKKVCPLSGQMHLCQGRGSVFLFSKCRSIALAFFLHSSHVYTTALTCICVSVVCGAMHPRLHTAGAHSVVHMCTCVVHIRAHTYIHMQACRVHMLKYMGVLLIFVWVYTVQCIHVSAFSCFFCHVHLYPTSNLQQQRGPAHFCMNTMPMCLLQGTHAQAPCARARTCTGLVRSCVWHTCLQ